MIYFNLYEFIIVKSNFEDRSWSTDRLIELALHTICEHSQSGFNTEVGIRVKVKLQEKLDSHLSLRQQPAAPAVNRADEKNFVCFAAGGYDATSLKTDQMERTYLRLRSRNIENSPRWCTRLANCKGRRTNLYSLCAAAPAQHVYTHSNCWPVERLQFGDLRKQFPLLTCSDVDRSHKSSHMHLIYWLVFSWSNRDYSSNH